MMMKKMKMCFVGIGSIAKRHIHNLREIGTERNIELEIDAYRRSAEEVDGVDHVFTDYIEVPDEYDAIFITNPTSLHLETLLQFQQNGHHFFIEKPVVSVDQIGEAKKIKLKKDAVYYVACPLRYNAVIQYIKKNILPEDVVSVRSISSSYLPDWRPGQDYRITYSAHKDLGGGVDIDLVHEWDYLTYLFGMPNKVESIIGKKSNLEIDSNDYAIYIAECKDKVMELHLDYFGRKTIREVQLFTKEETIVGDLSNNQIVFLKDNRIIDFREERDDFQKRELRYFLDVITDKYPVADAFHSGLQVLELTQGRLT